MSGVSGGMAVPTSCAAVVKSLFMTVPEEAQKFSCARFTPVIGQIDEALCFGPLGCIHFESGQRKKLATLGSNSHTLA